MKSRRSAWRNWSKTVEADPSRIERPADAEATQAIIRDALAHGSRVRPVGNGFSASGIAVSPEIAVDVTALRGLVRVDAEAGLATFLPGTTLGEAMAALEDVGLAFESSTRNVDVTLGGIIATGGHGWGHGYGPISSFLTEMKLVTGTGELITVSARKNAELWSAARINLGALGIMTELTFRVVPAYTAKVTERLENFLAFTDKLEERMAGAHHVQASWRPHTGRIAVTRAMHVPHQASGAIRPGKVTASGQDFRSQLRIGVGRVVPALVPTLNRLANVFNTSRMLEGEPQAALASRPEVPVSTLEYSVPIAATGAVLRELDRAIERQRLAVPSEVFVTTTAPDDAYLAQSYGREVGNISVRMPSSMNSGAYFACAEEIFIDYEGLPHWAGAHTLRAEEIAYVLPRFGDFLSVRHRLDPNLMFTNPYLERVLGE